MHPTRVFKSTNACMAVVGEGRPDRFADGAATGTPASSMSRLAMGCDGMRTATDGWPAVTRSGTARDFGSRTVSGPGQKRSSTASRYGIDAHAAASTSSASALLCAMWTMSGLSLGRCLARKIPSQARASSAFAPSPYTVSVGSTTTSPCRRSAAGRSKSASSIAWGSTLMIFVSMTAAGASGVDEAIARGCTCRRTMERRE
eukprot:Amastigsp_a174555_19.p2 type:complete len:202 gc:universal Amastigsp_a174555_19:697-92(-)